MSSRVFTWLAERRTQLPLKVSALPWSENKEWSFNEGALTHRTDRFFSIRGYHFNLPGTPWEDSRLPLIDQPEVGLLAFIARETDGGMEWLLQAKAEPGTEGYVQVGPSVQATKSNYERAHGGAGTHFLETFVNDREFTIPVSLQTEQGTRFFKKKNANAIAVVSHGDLEIPGPDWAWFSSADLRDALLEDFAINTDARSVLATGDWELLSETGAPFSASSRPQPAQGFVSMLRGSYLSVDEANLPTEIEYRDDRAEVISLEEITGWERKSASLEPRGGDSSYDIRSYAIEAPGREVSAWQQPLLRGIGRGQELLVMAERDGVLKLFLRDSIEPGFAGAVGLGSSFSTEGFGHSWVVESLRSPGATQIARVLQSDEGGRFMKSIASYEIWLLQNGDHLPAADGIWVSLGEAKGLLKIEGLLTNEARSLLSMLLAWA